MKTWHIDKEDSNFFERNLKNKIKNKHLLGP